MTDDLVPTLRRFNRTWSQRVGVLAETHLGTGISLGHNRVLFEVGTGGATVRDLRERLALDSGYLSRLLAALESDGLVEVRPDPADRRRRTVTLTATGDAALRRLDADSADLAGTLVEPLTPRQRGRLAEALATADLLVRAATLRLVEVDPAAPAARAAVASYVEELAARLQGGFDPTPPTPADDEALRVPDGCFVVALSDGEPVACGGVRRIAPGVGEVKRMWVDDRWRGAGLGSRVLRDLEERARALGHRVLCLDTRSELTEAVALYERAGFVRTDSYNDNPYPDLWFEKQLARHQAPAGR